MAVKRGGVWNGGWQGYQCGRNGGWGGRGFHHQIAVVGFLVIFVVMPLVFLAVKFRHSASTSATGHNFSGDGYVRMEHADDWRKQSLTESIDSLFPKEVFPKMDKILFWDDDIVVQKDFTPTWSVDIHGKVNGSVETCGEGFHRFDKYLNFFNPHIARHFDHNAYGWAYGMKVFDLKEWKKQGITRIYHKWQNMNEDRVLWNLGTLPLDFLIGCF